MRVHHYQEIYPFIIIDEMYSESELEAIWEELNFLCYPSKLEKDPHKSGTAIDQDTKEPLKNNNCIWLDQCYSDRKYSNILSCNRKLFLNNLEIFKDHPNWFFQSFQCNRDNTLLSYYENGDFYKPHYDDAFCTVLTWFYKEPQRFTGGDLNLYYKGARTNIVCKNNRTVVFPSSIFHEVEPIRMEEKFLNTKNGRFCMTQFLSSQ